MTIPRYATLAERFWAKVKIGAPHECWEWTATRHKRGYGCFRIGHNWHRSSRVAWSLTNGEAPASMGVLHSCDNPPCCNPAHLFLGTQLDNVRDMASKGRRADQSGENHPRAKLTRDLVAQARQRVAAGEISVARLARLWEISESALRSAVAGETWK